MGESLWPPPVLAHQGSSGHMCGAAPGPPPGLHTWKIRRLCVRSRWRRCPLLMSVS